MQYMGILVIVCYCDISPASICIRRTKIFPREDQGVWLQQAAPPALRASPPRDATFRPPGLFVQQNRCGLDTAWDDLQLFFIGYKATRWKLMNHFKDF